MLRGGDTAGSDPDRHSSGTRATLCAAGNTWGGHRLDICRGGSRVWRLLGESHCSAGEPGRHARHCPHARPRLRCAPLPQLFQVKASAGLHRPLMAWEERVQSQLHHLQSIATSYLDTGKVSCTLWLREASCSLHIQPSRALCRGDRGQDRGPEEGPDRGAGGWAHAYPGLERQDAEHD